jgi:hypothetical protein
MAVRSRSARLGRKTPALYSCIVKIYEPGNPAGRWAKWRGVSSLTSFRAFLDRTFRYPTGWLFCNVYDKRYGTRQQLGSFTRNGPPPPRRYAL